MGQNEEEKDVFTLKYIFSDNISICGLYKLKSFEQSVIQTNQNTLTLKIIASRVCQAVGAPIFDKSLSSS